MYQSTITNTRDLKVTISKDNDIRFKVPEDKQDLYDLDLIADKLMEYPVIVESTLTLRGKLDKHKKVSLTTQNGSKANRKRNHVYTVFFEDDEIYV